MKTTLNRPEVLAFTAKEMNPYYRFSAAKDLFRAAALILGDDDDGQMAQEIANLIEWESAPFRDLTEDDVANNAVHMVDDARECLATLYERMDSRLEAIAAQVAA